MNVNTVNFGDIIKEISHGLMAESYISDNEFTKPCEYLRLVDIDDGVIAENCIEIVYDSKRFEKYAIKDGDVILSTTDKNFKVVCAGDMGDRKLLVSPTLIRIGLDKEKADPYYIAAYLMKTMSVFFTDLSLLLQSRQRYLTLFQPLCVQYPYYLSAATAVKHSLSLCR